MNKLKLQPKVKLVHPYYGLERKVSRKLEGRFLTVLGYITWMVVSLLYSVDYLLTNSLSVSMLASLALGLMLFFVFLRLSTLLMENLFQNYLDVDLIKECAGDLYKFDDTQVIDAVDRLAEQRDSFVQTRTTLPVILVSVLVGLWAIPSVDSFLLLMAIIFTAPGSLVLLRELRRARAATIIRASVEEVRFQLYQEQKLQEMLVLAPVSASPKSIDSRLLTVYTTPAPKKGAPPAVLKTP